MKRKFSVYSTFLSYIRVRRLHLKVRAHTAVSDGWHGGNGRCSTDLLLGYRKYLIGIAIFLEEENIEECGFMK